MENLTYYALCIVAFIIGVWLLKRCVGCLIRTIITIIILAGLAYIYFNFYS
ncbi:hypothetical protein HPS57_00360 [Prevotella sp. PINT]|uniref:hypothetical protein n=1 Tax=Palleniella intestinalis TaxID=2736291 RepID=UPI001556CA0F|nr:hypothetical protein [Palleniella intestinalis]NPD80435.1 hypothetical protein [Palleniella intestinalis]